MAELLIRLKNNTNADPVKDRMCYKRGDIVVTKPDAHHWGRAEGLPDFAVIRVDRTVAQMEQYLAVHEVEKFETQEVSLVEWTREKARGGKMGFNQQPIEGGTRLIRDKGRRRAFITLSGPVLRPHTRRKWRVNIGAFSMRAERGFRSKGFIVIPFSDLRIALTDKIGGGTA